MKRFGFFILCSLVFLSLMMIGCAKEPVQELGAARAAVASAKAARADKYVPQEFAALQDSLKSAEAEIAKQNAASVFSRNYTKAKATLISIMSLAAPLNTKAVDTKTRMMADAANAISIMTASLNDAKGLLKKAPKGKDAKLLFEASAKDIAAIEAGVPVYYKLMNQEDYSAAIEKANADAAKLTSIKTELSAATEKSAGQKSKKKK